MRRSEILGRMHMRLPAAKQIRVIVYSDVKNEADDQFAVVHHLLTPNFDVRAVIAAHFESKAPGSRATMEQSYQELLTLMESMEIDDVPMLRGCVEPLSGETDAPESEGVDFIIREALREDERPLYVAAQGALTDIAAALNRCPGIAERMTTVWIGGASYPHGGREFNLMQDVAAARVVFGSAMPLWQITLPAYSMMEVTMAELAYRVRPCGKPGRYLYGEIEQFNLDSDEPLELRRGENWCLGDQPAVGVLLQCGWRNVYHMEHAPRIADDMTYEENPEGKLIRVYTCADARMIMEDFYAKLAMCYRGGRGENYV